MLTLTSHLEDNGVLDWYVAQVLTPQVNCSQPHVSCQPQHGLRCTADASPFAITAVVTSLNIP